MPQKLSEEDIKEILRDYHETESKSKTAENLGHSRSTVRKYVDEYYEQWADTAEEAEVEAEGGEGEQTDAPESDDGHVTDALAPEEASAPDDSSPAPGPAPGGSADAPPAEQGNWTATPPSETPMGAPEDEGSVADAGDDPDFARMGYGEFVQWFFSQQGHGVREDFAEIMAQNARMKQQLPDEDSMKRFILDGASGVNNDFNAGMIAENYWAVAERYLEEQPNTGDSHYESRGWVDRDQGQNGQQPPQQQGQGQQAQQGQENEWVGGGQQQSEQWSHPNGGQAWGQQGQGQGRQRQQRQPAGQQAVDYDTWTGQNQQSQGSDPRVEQLAEAFKGVQETQQKILQNMNGDDNDNQTLKQQMREFRQAKEELEAIAGDDNDGKYDQVMQELVQKMNQLEHDMKTSQSSGGEGGAGEMQWMVQLLQQDDMDPDTVTNVAEAMGATTTDPEVKKAEFELQKEQMKAENRKEMVDSVFNNVGEAVEAVTGSAIESMLGGGGDDGGQQQPQDNSVQQQGQPPAPQPAQQPQSPAGGGGGQPMSGPASRFEEIANEEPDPSDDGGAPLPGTNPKVVNGPSTDEPDEPEPSEAPDMEELTESAESAADEEDED